MKNKKHSPLTAKSLEYIRNLREAVGPIKVTQAGCIACGYGSGPFIDGVCAYCCVRGKNPGFVKKVTP